MTTSESAMSDCFQLLRPRSVELSSQAHVLDSESMAIAVEEPFDAVVDGEKAQRWLPPNLDDHFTPTTSSQDFISHDVESGHSSTVADIETIREQAYQDGFSQGLADAESQSKQVLMEQCQRLQMAMAALREPQAVIDQSVEDELLQMTVCLAKQLLRREITLSPEYLKEMIEKSIKRLPILNNTVQIYLNPEDLAVLNELCQGSDADENWQLYEDETLSQGGFRIHSGDSTIDDSVETRLAGLLSQIEEEPH